MPRDPEATADLVEDLRTRATSRHREPRNPFSVDRLPVGAKGMLAMLLPAQRAEDGERRG